MFHLLPFAVGLLAGAAAVRLIRDDKTRDGLEKAQERLREATVSSLSAIEQSSARLRDRLVSAPDAVEPAAEPGPAPESAPTSAKEGGSE